MNAGLEDRIRERAYRIWEATGRPAGRSVEHWLEASGQIAAETLAIAGTSDDANIATQALPAAADVPEAVTDGVMASKTVPLRKPRVVKSAGPIAPVAKAASRKKPDAEPARH